jgi:hypothetical protein
LEYICRMPITALVSFPSPGIFPDRHMNKAHWITVALDSTVEDEIIRFLLNMSHRTYKITKRSLHWRYGNDRFIIVYNDSSRIRNYR